MIETLLSLKKQKFQRLQYANYLFGRFPDHASSSSAVVPCQVLTESMNLLSGDEDSSSSAASSSAASSSAASSAAGPTMVKKIAEVFCYLLWSKSLTEEEELKTIFREGVNEVTLQV